MRVGFVALLVLSLGCGDDDVAFGVDSGFVYRDASFDAGCLPYYLAAADRERDAGLDDAGAFPLTCGFTVGALDPECTDIAWSYAGGEHLALPGCCTEAGQCGVVDPTGALGCVDRRVFGVDANRCTYDASMDAGTDDASDEDAAVPTT